MKINQKKSPSKPSVKPETTPSRKTKSAGKEKRSSPDEAADSLAQPVHPARPVPRSTPPTPSPTSTLANGTPRAAIIERVRLEALHLRTQEVVKALTLVSSSANQCLGDAYFIARYLPISQEDACTFIQRAASTAAGCCDNLRPAVLAFETRMAPNAQLNHRENLVNYIQEARTQLMSHKEELESFLRSDLNEPMRPLLERYASIFTAAKKAFDDALDLVREMRVLHLTAAKYA